MIPKTFRWLNIIRKPIHSFIKSANASYDVKTNTIIVYDRMVNKTQEEIDIILLHEWIHHIYMTKVPMLYKTIWKLIDNWKLRQVLNVLEWTNYKENAYVSWASKANSNEGFAWTLAQWASKWHHNNYIDVKIKFWTNILNHFK